MNKYWSLTTSADSGSSNPVPNKRKKIFKKCRTPNLRITSILLKLFHLSVKFHLHTWIDSRSTPGGYHFYTMWLAADYNRLGSDVRKISFEVGLITKTKKHWFLSASFVGKTGFEPATPWSQTKRRHQFNLLFFNILYRIFCGNRWHVTQTWPKWLFTMRIYRSSV